MTESNSLEEQLIANILSPVFVVMMLLISLWAMVEKDSTGSQFKATTPGMKSLKLMEARDISLRSPIPVRRYTTLQGSAKAMT